MEKRLSPEERIQNFIKMLEANIAYYNTHYPENPITLLDVLSYVQSKEYEEQLKKQEEDGFNNNLAL